MHAHKNAHSHTKPYAHAHAHAHTHTQQQQQQQQQQQCDHHLGPVASTPACQNARRRTVVRTVTTKGSWGVDSPFESYAQAFLPSQTTHENQARPVSSVQCPVSSIQSTVASFFFHYYWSLSARNKSLDPYKKNKSQLHRCTS